MKHGPGTDNDDDLFLWYGWPTKGVWPYFQSRPLSEILTIANLRNAAFRLYWMKLCNSNNNYTTTPRATRQRQKKLTITSCQTIVTSLSFFWFIANSGQSGSRIPAKWFVKLTFSIIVTFYITKAENRTKKSLTQLSHYCFK